MASPSPWHSYQRAISPGSRRHPYNGTRPFRLQSIDTKPKRIVDGLDLVPLTGKPVSTLCSALGPGPPPAFESPSLQETGNHSTNPRRRPRSWLHPDILGSA